MKDMPDDKYLGYLCLNGHEYESTGKSIRYVAGNKCVECKRLCQKRYRQNNKEELAVYNKGYWEKLRNTNPDKRKEYSKRYGLKHPYKHTHKHAYKQNKRTPEQNKRYRIINKEQINARGRKRYHEKMKNPRNRIEHSVSAAIQQCLRKGKGKRHWETLVGYTTEELIKHLESQFTDGMSWDNYGVNGWHVDHIIPKSVFNYDSPDDIDFKRCWALSNLRPMWGSQNIRKSNKIEYDFQPSLKLKIASYT